MFVPKEPLVNNTRSHEWEVEASLRKAGLKVRSHNLGEALCGKHLDAHLRIW